MTTILYNSPFIISLLLFIKNKQDASDSLFEKLLHIEMIKERRNFENFEIIKRWKQRQKFMIPFSRSR